MGDNIRNKAIFEIKVAKIAQKLQNLTFCKIDPDLAQCGSTFYSY